MGAEFLHRSFEDEAINHANQTEVLDGRDEIGTRQDVSRLVTYPQQALEVIDDPRGGAHYRLISKQQPVLVQRGFYRADYRRIALLSAVRDIPALVHLSGASAFFALYERPVKDIARPTSAGPHSAIQRVNAREAALDRKLAVEILKNS
jgi:hypothetical protein